MYNEARCTHVNFRPLDEVDQQLPDINKMSESELQNNYIHDSRYFWERFFNKKDRDVYYPNTNYIKVEPKIINEDRKGTHEGILSEIE